MDETTHEQFHRLLEGLNGVLAEVYGEENLPAIVVGVQHQGDGEHECLVTSNLPVCLVPDAIVDMHAESIRQHDRVHGDGVSEDGSEVRQRVSLDNVPPEVRERALQLAQELGISPEEIAYVEVADISDLRDAPETSED